MTFRPCKTKKCENFVPLPEPGKSGRPREYCHVCDRQRDRERNRKKGGAAPGTCKTCGIDIPVHNGRGRQFERCLPCRRMRNTWRPRKYSPERLEFHLQAHSRLAALYSRADAEQALIDEAHRLSATGLIRRDVARAMRKQYDTVSKLLSQLPTSHPAYKPLDSFLIPDPPRGSGENLNSST